MSSSSPAPINKTLENEADDLGYDERISVLQKSLADVQKPETLKHRTGRNLLAHAELMFDILDGLKDVHSYIGVATIPFRATLKIILVKQDNDKRIAALTVEMIDMMSPLIELRSIKPEERQTATGETVQSNLTRVLTIIKDNIEEVGNLVDCYTKARTWHRVLHVREWAEKFKDMAETLQKGKSNILIALGTHTALSVEKLHPKVDYVLKMMQEWFERPQSADERRFLELVNQGGGQKYLENESAFIDLYKANGSGERARETASGSGDRQIDDDREKTREAKEAWEELKVTLTNLLSENRSIYEAKLEVQKRDLTTVIRQSETTIIRAMNEGPYAYITHPDIQELWKAMHWRLSVKTRHFVMALHDHYLHSTYTTSLSASSSHADNSATRQATRQNTLRGAPALDPADKWCLEYLKIRHLPAISEAFDDDGSGFIRISEVNDFTDGIPKGWNLLKWVAYWTASWPTEIERYSRLIQETMAQIAEAQCNVKLENIEYVNDYMTGFAFSQITEVVTSIEPRATPTTERSELQRLAAAFRSQTEKTLEENLKTVKYNIDGPDTLQLLCGAGRIEKYLFPLLHLLLKQHLAIVTFASAHALDSREMDAADTSLSNVMFKVYQRVEELKESFRQQRLDINEQFKHFACGIYSKYQYSYVGKGLGRLPQRPTVGDDEAESSSYEDWESGSDSESESSKSEEQSLQPSQADLVDPPQGELIHPDVADSGTPDNSIPVEGSPGTVDSIPSTNMAPVAVLQGEENAPASDPNSGPIVEANTATNEVANPTRYESFYLDTSLYSEPFTLTEDNTPWHPLDIKFSDVGAREMFKTAAQRVLERVQLLSPRMSWSYLARRRSIRLKWVEVALRYEDVYVGGSTYNPRVPSNEEVLEDLKLQIMPADVQYFDSLAELQTRLRARHTGYCCDGCYAEIFGKRFRCIDCLELGGVDLCNDCEHAEIPRHDVTAHPPSHTMMQLNYPVTGALAWFTRIRARKYMMKHLKCPCSAAERTAEDNEPASTLKCDGCQKEMRNEVHFRCLQCPDYDLCEDCERAAPPQHCIAHVLLKLKAPFVKRESEESGSESEDEEQPLSVEDRLSQLAQRMSNLETKFGSRLDQMQKDFTRVITLLEHAGTQEKRRAYLYESTKSPSL